ncbi:MAG TPA: hypothetical protein DCL66_14890 [Gammaproteobacteria bacterium]|nr:hypothetical protein [Gammaproteobacteria bacterium]
MVKPDYFYTDYRWQVRQRTLKQTSGH